MDVVFVWSRGTYSHGKMVLPKGETMDLEETLEKIVEHAREELHIVRKRAEEKTAARDHGREYHEAQTAADRLDHYAHQLRRLHDAEYKQGWRHESAGDE
jgi:hypothetical protein